jgi:hypothetical protein
VCVCGPRTVDVIKWMDLLEGDRGLETRCELSLEFRRGKRRATKRVSAIYRSFHDLRE